MKKSLAIVATLVIATSLLSAPGCSSGKAVKQEQQTVLNADAEIARQNSLIGQLQAQLQAEQQKPNPNPEAIAGLQQAAAAAMNMKNQAEADLAAANSKLAAMEASDRGTLATTKTGIGIISSLFPPAAPFAGLIEAAITGLGGLLLGRRYYTNKGIVLAGQAVAGSQDGLTQTPSTDPTVLFDRTALKDLLTKAHAPSWMIAALET